MRGEIVRPIVIAAGGTGGHFFPAEALASELTARGHRIALMTDARSGGERAAVFEGRDAYVLRGAGIAGRGVHRAVAAAGALASGTAQARRILSAIDPAAIIAFGGYPSVPPVIAARFLRRRPMVILHEQNAVLGRANRLLARFADHLALGMRGTTRLPARPPHSVTGNPVRSEIAALAGQAYTPPEHGGQIRLLVTGGSQGARVFGDALPAAIALLSQDLRRRLRVTQQVRAEDLERVRAAYVAMRVEAELSPFFADIAERLRMAHFVVARAGASTVAELAVAGRPALLVPFPFAIDRHQSYNAMAVDASMLEQAEFEHRPEVLAEALAHRIDCPDLLAVQAHAIAEHGIPDAATRLADLVEHAVSQETTS
jgi:UDP-N-acetylglucosamine--N-acetylmuramyl-(pentapeptide) pyrophosphoryl-undecaprenol N-acetylglucosamine transferase